jgi:PAT family beta-lactamase induction signal transducer AmpG
MAALIGIGMLGMALAPNTDEQGHTSSRRAFGEWARHAVIAPLVNLLRHRRWPVIFLFILFYKLGEVLALAMTSPLYVSLGYTKAEVATITKLFGFIATIVGSLAGGLLIKRAGIWFGLLIGGILQIVGQLAFFLLATNSHDLGLLTFSIGLENFSGGLGTAALVAYLSSLCAREYTATQYALLSALSAVALNIFTAPAGYLAAGVGWPLYYALTPLAALPGLALLVWIRPPKSGLEYRQ